MNFRKGISWTLICGTMLSVLCGCQQNPNPTDPGTYQPSEPTNQSSQPSEEMSEPTEPSETKPLPSLDLGYYTAEHYLAYPDLFVPSWADEWQPPAEMLDFEEKYASIMDPNGRLMSIGHRADRNRLYPENSIEAILSVVMAGVDMVELDVARTKDGVLVLIHDSTVNSTTDVSLKRGKPEYDLPESDFVCDWTLEQLRCLRLLHSGRVTNYVIPTLEEAIMVCKDRCFITLDKFDRFDWNFDVYPLIKKYQAYREVLVPFRYTKTMGLGTVQYLVARLRNESGYEPFYMAECSGTPESLAEITGLMDQCNLRNGLRCGKFDPATVSDYAPYIGKYRVYMETIGVAGREMDMPSGWSQIDDAGMSLLMSDNIYELIKFVSERYFAE